MTVAGMSGAGMSVWFLSGVAADWNPFYRVRNLRPGTLAPRMLTDEFRRYKNF